MLVYTTLFGTGSLILGWTVRGLACVTVALAAGASLWRDLQREEGSLIGMEEGVEGIGER